MAHVTLTSEAQEIQIMITICKKTQHVGSDAPHVATGHITASAHFIQCDGDPHRPSRFECQVEPSFQSDVAEWHRSISAKYGLRGIRVGEASHPGPVSRATSRRTQIDSDSDAPLVNSGRFMALSRDRDGSDEDVGAEPGSHQSGKRLRVTRRDRARASPGNTFTRDPSSVSGALEFDLTQLDSELEGPMPPAEALVEPTRESESDTESVRVRPRRRLVLQFARDEDNNNGSGDEHQRSEPVEEEFNEDLLAVTDFGQTDFGHPYFGQIRLWPNRLWPEKFDRLWPTLIDRLWPNRF